MPFPGSGDEPDLMVDCRLIPKRNTCGDFETYKNHAGWHPEHINQLIHHKDFAKLVADFKKKWRMVSAAKPVKPKTIYVFCKKGFHRSVAWSRIMQLTYAGAAEVHYTFLILYIYTYL